MNFVLICVSTCVHIFLSFQQIDLLRACLGQVQSNVWIEGDQPNTIFSQLIKTLNCGFIYPTSLPLIVLSWGVGHLKLKLPFHLQVLTQITNFAIKYLVLITYTCAQFNKLRPTIVSAYIICVDVKCIYMCVCMH